MSSQSPAPTPSSYYFSPQLPVRVEVLPPDGLSRTDSSFIFQDLEPAASSQTIGELSESLRSAKSAFDSYNIFEDVDFVVDTKSTASDSVIPTEVRSIFKEKPRQWGVRSMVTTSASGRPTVEFAGNVRNMFGKAERFQLKCDYEPTTNMNPKDIQNTTSTFNLEFWKPRVLSLPVPWSKSPLVLNSSLSVFNSNVDRRHISSFVESARGANVSLTDRNGSHEVAFEKSWRAIHPMRRMGDSVISRYVLDNARATEKRSLMYSWSWDTLNHPFLPTEGQRLHVFGELAGFGGDEKFMKLQSNFRIAKSLTDRLSVGGSLIVGGIKPFGGQMSTSLSDRFHISSPLYLRGFQESTTGPREGNDFIGGDAMAVSSVYTSYHIPKPEQLNELGTHVHAFANVGSLVGLYNDPQTSVKPKSLSSIGRDMSQSARLSVGVGIVFPTPIRVELNLVKPIWTQSGDRTRRFQLGIGLDY